MNKPAGMLRYLATIVATAIVVLFLLVSAIPLMHWFGAEGQIAALEENRAAWNQLDLRDYRFSIELTCGDCDAPAGIPLRVRVSDGQAREIVDLSTSTVLTPAGTTDLPNDVPALFTLVEAAIAADTDELRVSYDEIYGFPRDVRIDPDSDVSGDETAIRVSDFDPRQQGSVP